MRWVHAGATFAVSRRGLRSCGHNYGQCENPAIDTSKIPKKVDWIWMKVREK